MLGYSVFAIVVLVLLFDCVHSDCNTVSKQAWGGLSPAHVEYLPRPVGLVVVQHTVTAACSSDDSCAATVRSIQDYHMDTLKFWDIGSSFLIGGNGKVYEGAGWLHVGAHTYGYNRKSIGISFIGNFNNDEPTAAALEAARALLSCGVQRGHLKQPLHVVAQKQLQATESPGRRLYAAIRRWPDWLEDVSSIKN